MRSPLRQISTIIKWGKREEPSKWLSSSNLRQKSTFAATGFDTSSSKVKDRNYENAKPFTEIPGPRGFPYLGTVFQYRKGPFQRFNLDRYQEALLDRYREYGSVMKETIAGVTAVRLFDPDDIRTVYQHEGKIPFVTPLLDSTKQYREQKNMSPGLGNTNGEEWYRLRSAVQQMMMRPKEVTVYLPLISQVTEDFVTKIKTLRDRNANIYDFRNQLARWNLESSGMTCFESRLGCLEEGEDSWTQKMIHTNNQIFVLSTQLVFSVPFHKFWSSPKWKKLVAAEDFFFNNGQKIVNETIEKMKKQMDNGQFEDGKYNFLSYLLSRKELSYKDISIITLSLFGDGLNTTVPAFIFALYCLAKYPEIQEKAYQEVCQVVPPGEPVTAEAIARLTYLKACVKESSRFYPIGLEIKRIPQKNLVIGGYQLPAGTIVELCPFVHFNSSEHFIEPHKFSPERWLRDGSAHNIHPYLLTPFGHGPRMCAGRRFAEQDMYVLMTRLLQNFKIGWVGEDLVQKFQMLMVPDKPVTFTFADRNS